MRERHMTSPVRRLVESRSPWGVFLCALMACTPASESPTDELEPSEQGAHGHAQRLEQGRSARQERLTQLWVRSPDKRSASALQAAGGEVVGQRAGTWVVLMKSQAPLPRGFVARVPTPQEKMTQSLRESLARDPSSGDHQAEALMIGLSQKDAQAMVARHGLQSEGPLRAGGALWVQGRAEELEKLAAEPRVRVLAHRLAEPTASAPAAPLSPLNDRSRATSGVDALHPEGGAGLSLTGQGITLGIIDGGRVRSSHRDFGGRVSYRDGDENFSNHATHVSGTMIGAGAVRPEARGMAYESRLIGYSFFNDAVGKMASFSHTFTASNHSYGQDIGWSDGNGEWVWRGNRNFGKYDQNARRSDEVVYEGDAIWLKAAGNDRGDRPNQASDERPIDCHRGYDCISSGSLAKNLIIVGAVRDLPEGPSTVEELRLTGFTSFGPSDDGRIKPDLVANGQELLSTGSNGDEAYSVLSGTSMATPTITGIAGLLLELYADLHQGATPTAAEMKAVLIHTARSPLGQGRPDHRFGFGLVDAPAAAEMFIAASEGPGRVSQGFIGQESLSWTVDAVPGEDLVMTLVWSDPPGEVNTGGADDRTPALVNDLDLTMRPPGQEAPTRYPWRLRPDEPGADAVQDGPNRRDNVEKIVVPGDSITEAGQWTVTLRMDAEPFQGRAQPFALVSSHVVTPVEHDSPAMLAVGRVVRLRLAESAEAVEVPLPLDVIDASSVGYEVSIQELPAWLSLDRLEGQAPQEAPVATVNPRGLSNTTYEARLQVRNTDVAQAPVRELTFELEVVESDIPRARAGADRTVPSGAVVRMVGSGEDPSGDPLTFQWSQSEGPEVALSVTDAARTSFVAPTVQGDEPVSLVFGLQVSDGTFESVPDNITITVLPPFEGPGEPANNRCETASSLPVGLPYLVDAALDAQHDVDFVAVSLEAGQRVEVETYPIGEGIDTTLGIVALGGEVVVTDDDGGQGLYSFLSFAPEEAGTWCVAVSTYSDFAFDGAQARTGGRYGLSIVAEADNTAPVADAGDDQRVPAGRVVRLDGRRSADAERDALTFAWSQQEGVEVTLTGADAAQASFTAPEVEEETTLRFGLTVRDGELESVDEVVVVVEPGAVIGAQPFAGDDRSVAEGARIVLVGSADNLPQEAVTVGWRWRQVGGPQVELLRPTSVSPEFNAPLVDEPTTLRFELRVLEGEFLSIPDAVEITVVPTEGQGEPENNDCRSAPFVDALEWEAEGRLDGPHDVDYVRFQIRDQMTFLVETLPVGGQVVDTTLGLARIREGDIFDVRTTDDDGGLFQMSRLSGRFGGDGTICVAVSGHGDLRFFDGSFHEISGDYLLRLSLGAPAGNRPPTVTLPAQQLAEPGQRVTLVAEVNDPDGDPMTFAWRQRSGPPLALEDVESPSLSVSVPSALEEETRFGLTLQVSDGFSSAEAEVDLVVRSNSAPQLSPVAEVTVTEGDLVELQLEAVDPDDDELRYDAIDAPEGLSVNAESGVLRWETALGDAGERRFEVQVADPFGATARQPVLILVDPAENLPPEVEPIAPLLVEASGAETEVTLAVEASDPEQQPLTLTWSDAQGEVLAEGREVTLALRAGRQTLSVRVSDGVNEVTEEAQIWVLADDERPVASIGAPQQVGPSPVGEPVAWLDGRRSQDPFGRLLSFVWEVDDAERFELASHPEVTAVGELRLLAQISDEAAVVARLTVVVEDEVFGTIASLPSETRVRVVPGGNQPPVAQATGPERAAQDTVIEVDGAGSVDPEGEALRFVWALTRGDGEVAAPGAEKTEIALGEPRDPTPVGWTAVLMVSDGLATSAPSVVTVRRAAPEDLPNPEEMDGEGQDDDEDDEGDDPDGDNSAGINVGGGQKGGCATISAARGPSRGVGLLWGACLVGLLWWRRRRASAR